MTFYNLTKSREILEYLEECENKINDEDSKNVIINITPIRPILLKLNMNVTQLK